MNCLADFLWFFLLSIGYSCQSTGGWTRRQTWELSSLLSQGHPFGNCSFRSPLIMSFVSIGWVSPGRVCRLPKVKWNELFSLVWLFATPWTNQSMEFSRPEYWNGWCFPSPGDRPNPGIEPRSPALQVESVPAEPQGKPKNPGVQPP